MPPKILIAVASCHQYRVRADSQRATWVKELDQIPGHVDCDIRFFLGGGQPERSDEIILPVDDGYLGLPAKTKEICMWALERGYTNLYKSDDDSYVVLERLFASGCEKFDYAGRLRGPSGMFKAPYCSGFAYWLSAKAMRIIADAKLNGDEAEDRFVGNTLLQAGIWGQPDYRYVVVNSGRNAISGKEAPRQGNDVIAACEFTPDQMEVVHREWLNLSSRIVRRTCSGPLSKVCVLVKTFLRDQYFLRCIRGIEKVLPEVKMVMVDDGYHDKQKSMICSFLRELGHVYLVMEFDSGFGAKGNKAIPYFQDHQYVLIASDDFDFETPGLRAGIEKMVTVLDHDPSIHIVSGRVNGQPYESCLEVNCKSVKEHAGHRETRMAEGVEYKICDLTVNFSLVRTSCFGPGKLHWDGKDIKIGGGEHGAFYLDAKRLGYGVAVIPDVNIREFPFDFSQMHPMYPQMRNRAKLPGRACLRARGIERWQLQDGNWETT
jgi:hypothetical protein